MKQIPKTESVQPGKSLTIQCSLFSKNTTENTNECPDQCSVYWFRAGSQDSHPGVIYTEKTRCDEGEERSCVYSLSKTIQDPSDTGIYFCAVISCGQILFGEGTKVEIGMFLNPLSSSNIKCILTFKASQIDWIDIFLRFNLI